MRKIKFRAWDKENKRMLYDGIILDMSDCSRHSTMNGFSGHSPVNIELMQFTGLLDSEGREIFEGDRIKRILFNSSGVPKKLKEDGPKSIGEIVFDAGHFLIDWGKNPEGWSETLKYHAGESEIIGNRFENPDLLTPPEEG